MTEPYSDDHLGIDKPMATTMTDEMVAAAANRILSELDEATRVSRFSRVEEADLELVARAALQSIGPMRGWEPLPENVVNRLYAYDVPNSGSQDGQEFLDAVAEGLKSIGIEDQG